MTKGIRQFIGSRVRAARKARSQTQQELAEKIGRAVESVSNIERAETLPTLETLIALSEALEVPLRDLFPAGQEGKIRSAKRQQLESQLWQTMGGLSDKNLEIALKQIAALKS
jgi:transcriptional regulator with XRE-family HTH domain